MIQQKMIIIVSRILVAISRLKLKKDSVDQTTTMLRSLSVSLDQLQPFFICPKKICRSVEYLFDDQIDPLNFDEIIGVEDVTDKLIRGLPKFNPVFLDDVDFVGALYNYLQKVWYMFARCTLDLNNYVPKVVEMINNRTRPGYIFSACCPRKCPDSDDIQYCARKNIKNYTCGRTFGLNTGFVTSQNKFILSDTVACYDDTEDIDQLNRISQCISNDFCDDICQRRRG